MAEAPPNPNPSSPATEGMGSASITSPADTQTISPSGVLSVAQASLNVSSPMTTSGTVPSIPLTTLEQEIQASGILDSRKRKEAPQSVSEPAKKIRKDPQSKEKEPALNLSLTTIDSLPSKEKSKSEDKKPAATLSGTVEVDVTGSESNSTTSLSGTESSDPEFDVKKEAPNRPRTRSTVATSAKDGKTKPPKGKSAGSSALGGKTSYGRHKKARPSTFLSKGKNKATKELPSPLPPKKRTIEVFPVPSVSNFVDPAARTLCTSITTSRPIVYERGFDFPSLPPFVEKHVEDLGWKQALESFPKVNLSLVYEFYANFSELISCDVKVKSKQPINVWVRDIHVDISPLAIRKALKLPSTENGVVSWVKKFIEGCSIQFLGDKLYTDGYDEPVTTSHLFSQYMSEFSKCMSFVVRSLLTPSTQTSKITQKQAALMLYIMQPNNPVLPAEYYIYQNIHRAAVLQRKSLKASLLFPAVITKLCIDAGVDIQDDDIIVPHVQPVDFVTIHKSAGQAGIYVESLEHTALKKEMQGMVDKAVAAMDSRFQAIDIKLDKLKEFIKELATTESAKTAEAGAGTAVPDNDSRSGSQEKAKSADKEPMDEEVVETSGDTESGYHTSPDEE